MASRFNVEPAKLLGTLKNTVFKGASDDELLALVVVANEYGLNPLTKEIYAFPAKGGGIVPVVSVDGWNNVANSHPQMDGMEFEFAHDEGGKLVSCTCIIWRKDRNRPIKVTEYLSECRRNTDPWRMEHRMLRHKALIQCARVAFGFSGVYDEDDARTITGNVMDVPAAVVPTNFPAASGSPELGGSGGIHNAASGSVKQTGQPKAKDSAPFVLDDAAPTLREIIAAKLQASGLTWEQVANAAEKGGLFIEANASLVETPDDVLNDMIAAWPNLEPMAKEVQP